MIAIAVIQCTLDSVSTDSRLWHHTHSAGFSEQNVRVEVMEASIQISEDRDRPQCPPERAMREAWE